ncbi:Aste57867_1708 [Aphanomyces stellatus]|uniref:Aste57867_1708 protein n=1 Tax=Aphanomyces stellatus TaxID=120398 RepID=A0A485K6B9_9STRA|nr:hypothetical protein As57867_001706 [Aphanomyces stellatus]VFT78919.1 Aste57867_1708 [Aphanomyces stellatus]
MSSLPPPPPLPSSSATARQCTFCPKPAISDGKCHDHRYRLRCSITDCPNQVYARNLCVKHGGKPQCEVPDCTRNARRHGRCCVHMKDHQERKLCAHPGCEKFATSRGNCVRHGGGRQCKWENCMHYARQEGLCVRHFRARAAIPVLQERPPSRVDGGASSSPPPLRPLTATAERESHHAMAPFRFRGQHGGMLPPILPPLHHATPFVPVDEPERSRRLSPLAAATPPRHLPRRPCGIDLLLAHSGYVDKHDSD